MTASRLVGVSAVLLTLIILATGSASVAGATAPGHASTSTVSFGNNVSSTNWAGYAVSDGSKFTEVVGTWKEPSVVGTCPSAARYASFWVGIDGYSSTSVEQLGTDSDCSGAAPAYYAWYEMYPAGSVNLGSHYPVHAGDTLTAEVRVVGTSFTLSLKDPTSSWTFSITKSGSGLKQSSAEWIAESPEICSSTCSLAKLTDFGSVSFSHCEAAVGGSLQPISAFTASGGPHKITMNKAGGAKVRASPNNLGSSGQSFAVHWKSD